MTELDDEVCHLAWFPIAAVWTGAVLLGIAGAVLANHLSPPRRTS